MSVALNPSSTLGFNRPLTQHVKRTLTISNHNAQPVAFKVKTTAPRLYCVRPNSGRVEPGESVEVQVMLQAMKEEPPLAAKCKDKFLIQSTIISPEKEALPLQDIWNGEPPEGIHSQKIRVAYLPPEGQTVPEEEEQPQPAAVEPPAGPSDLNASGYATVQNREPEPAAPIPQFTTQDSPAHPAEPELHVDAPSTPPPELPVQEDEPVQEDVPEPPAVVNVNVHTPSAPAAAPPPPPAPVVQDPNPELVAKLHEAYAEIERLRNLISAMPDPSTVPTTTVSASAVPTDRTELRRRRGRAPSDDASTYIGSDVTSYVDDNMTQPDGVPLQIVIIVALGVFITTYLFF